MHLIECADYGGPYAGSFVSMLAATAHEAGRRGHLVTAVFSDIARERPWLADLEGAAELRFVSARASRVAGVGPVTGELRRALSAHTGPATIHTHFATFDIPAALMRPQRRDLRVFWHEHGPVLDDTITRLRNTLRYACFGRLADGMLCVSPELRRQLLARHAPPHRLHTFPNGIDTRAFSPPGEHERHESRQALGITDHARVILHFGWDWERKGGDLMLAAADILASDSGRERDLVVLTVLGENATSIPSGAGSGIVRALPTTNDTRALYAASDVFVSASRSEGALPLAALEALACGLRLVVSDIPVQSGLIEELPGAATVIGNSAAIAGGIRQVLALGEAERAEHARLAVELIRSRFALDAWARRLIDLFEAAPGPSS